MLRSPWRAVGKSVVVVMAAVVVGTAITSCASIEPPATSGGSAAQVVVKIVCPPIPTYTPTQERALGAAVAALPATSPLVGAMADYGAVRAAVRACKGT